MRRGRIPVDPAGGICSPAATRWRPAVGRSHDAPLRNVFARGRSRHRPRCAARDRPVPTAPDARAPASPGASSPGSDATGPSPSVAEAPQGSEGQAAREEAAHPGRADASASLGSASPGTVTVPRGARFDDRAYGGSTEIQARGAISERIVSGMPSSPAPATEQAFLGPRRARSIPTPSLSARLEPAESKLGSRELTGLRLSWCPR